MKLLYSIGIYIARFVIMLLALFNTKLKQGVYGRKETFQKLEKAIRLNDKTFWFHCASLGEYEQGLPVFEALKANYPDYIVVLSFFSPSGYEVRKNAAIADVVVYLPLDTKANAKRFLDLVHPNYTLFVKYEIWPNFLEELKQRKLKAVLISAVFRGNQSFFKWYGGFMKKALFAFNHIFTQDKNSKLLLERINYDTVYIAGDTRYDRVSNQLQMDNTVDFISAFKDECLCVVLGSTWPKDDELVIDYINNNAASALKFIVAPHNIKPSYVASIKSQINADVICFSELKTQDVSQYKVFILDTIGYLSKVYSYADIAYVGGAAGTTGLHNVLEPAVFGVPIIIGKNYDKFPEANLLIQKGGMHAVTKASEFETLMTQYLENESIRLQHGKINSDFVIHNKGAVGDILTYINTNLL